MDSTRKKITEGGTGSNIKSLNQQVLSDLEIPLPPRETQEQIILYIEEERRLVENNERLIEIFEQKIKDRVSEIWGRGDAALEAESDPISNYIAASEEELETPQIAQVALFPSF
jgi:restriction endonuclease S subunit